MGSRSIKPCKGCGEEREIAAHGLCFKCYRREEREQKELWVKPDRHATQLRKAQRTTRNAWMKIWNALDEIVDANLVPESTCEQIREVLGPEIAKIAASLEASVNSEHKGVSEPFTAGCTSDPQSTASTSECVLFPGHSGVTFLGGSVAELSQPLLRREFCDIRQRSRSGLERR